jgi:hypothetical protein
MRARQIVMLGLLFLISTLLSVAPCAAQDIYIITNGKFAGEKILTVDVGSTAVVLADNEDQGAVGNIAIQTGSIAFTGTMRSGTPYSERVRRLPVRLQDDFTEAERNLSEAVMDNLRAFNRLREKPPDFAQASVEVSTALDFMLDAQDNLLVDVQLGIITAAAADRVRFLIQSCVLRDNAVLEEFGRTRPSAVRAMSLLITAQLCKRLAFGALLKAEPLTPL